MLKKKLISDATQETEKLPIHVALYRNLAQLWGWPSLPPSLSSKADGELPRLTCLSENICHAIKFQHFRLTNADEMESVRCKVVAPAAQIALNYREGADPRYAFGFAAMLSFKVPDNPFVYHFFLRGQSAPRRQQLQLFLETLVKKPILTLTMKTIVRTLLGFNIDFNLANVRSFATEMTAGINSGNMLAKEVLGHNRLCRAYCHDVYDQFSNVSEEALDHIGADLYLYEKYALLHDTKKPHSGSAAKTSGASSVCVEMSKAHVHTSGNNIERSVVSSPDFSISSFDLEVAADKIETSAININTPADDVETTTTTLRTTTAHKKGTATTTTTAASRFTRTTTTFTKTD